MNQDLDIQLVRSLMLDEGTPNNAARDRARSRLLAAANRNQRRRLAWRRPLRGGPVRHGRLVSVLSVLVIGGGVAVAATTVLSQQSVSLVVQGVTCVKSPQIDGPLYGVQQRGRTPRAACAAAMHVSPSHLVVCVSPFLGLNVLERRGNPADQCRSFGMTARLPTGYRQATAAVATLDRDLSKLYASRNCFPPKALEADTRALLKRLGFANWRVTGPQFWAAGGPCGEYSSSGVQLVGGHSARPDSSVVLPGQGMSGVLNATGFSATGALESAQKLTIFTGPSRSVQQAIERSAPVLFSAPPQPSARCTAAGVEGYVTSILRRTGATGRVHFLISSEPQYPRRLHSPLSRRQQARYNAGCPVLASLGSGFFSSGFMAELWQRGHHLPGASGVVVQSGATLAIR